ncbi:hypothetical protein GQ43DRAFT_252454 [Delitschia confertaspora ATCC 74209]|uniref:Zn(2)-C6 fungal-type domain-containing protein n=1 Tax=Delitschia confertaspora ATCC 74209 TaxID=1513339 RepID=A0A9P4MMX3_9PLEO|nr:hypothetical protein GQ43DRAFT_252454 [Delitschia confertaspora ATCC 74209]
MSGNNLRPLLPAPPGQRRIIDEDTVPARSKSRAPPVLAACSPCRTARTKCDGVRPSCGRCNTRGDTCAYDVDPNTTRMEGLKQKVTTLQFECNELHELYKYLRTKTEVEAIGILKRIRDTEDPLVVLNIIRDGTFCYNLQLCEKVPEVW